MGLETATQTPRDAPVTKAIRYSDLLKALNSVPQLHGIKAKGASR